MKEHLLHQMKPSSALGQDGFTGRWVRQFWTDLDDLRHTALNGCYEEIELTTLLRTAVLKIIRKVKNADWNQQTHFLVSSTKDQDASQEDWRT